MREKSCSGVARYEALRDATCALGTNEPITTTAAASRVTPQMTIRTIFIRREPSFGAEARDWRISPGSRCLATQFLALRNASSGTNLSHAPGQELYSVP